MTAGEVPKLRTVTFYARTWKHHEENNLCYIFITGKTKKGRSVTVRVDNFCPFVYMELPPPPRPRTKWSESDVRGIYQHFRSKMTNGPTAYHLDKKYDLYHKTVRQYIMFTFKSKWHADDMSKKCNGYHNIRGVHNFGRGELRVHEHNIDPIIKFRSLRGLKPSGWITATEYIPKAVKDGDAIKDFADTDISMYCLWNNLSHSDSKEFPPAQRIVSFDIETYSKNHNAKNPDPKVPENVIFQIALTLQVGTDEKNCSKFLLTLFSCPNIEGVKVINYKDERSLLLGFAKILLGLKPDIIIGYNILKFDWDYIIVRAEDLGIINEIKKISRIKILSAEIGTCSWSSSAYGAQEFKYLDHPGIQGVDILPEMYRNYKFDKYSLEFVSQYFLGEGKEAITYRQLFRIVEISSATNRFVLQDEISELDIDRIKKYIRKLIDEEELHDVDGKPTVIKEFTDKIFNAYDTDEMKTALVWGIFMSGVYCVKDTYLPIRLMFKLHILDGLEQMSNTVGLPITYLQTRGQQIKVLSMVYNRTHKQNIVIPYKAYHKETIKKYQGATVFKAVPGFYRNVACLDFSSLYPSIIIAYNICWTTFVIDDTVPDEDCYILEFDEHYLCEHDPDVISGKKKCQVGKMKKTKQKDGTFIQEEVITLCGHHRYRYLKPKMVDGKLINEGVLPALLKNVLAERKMVKKEMAENEMYVKMHDGKVLDEDIAFAKKMGWRIVEKGSLTEQEYKDAYLRFVRANALQLALKISANSCYGSLGAKTGFMPLLEGASSVTAMGRMLIAKTAKHIKDNYPLSKLVYGDTDSVMIQFNAETLEKDFEVAKKASNEVSNILPRPLFLEFENMYWKMLLLSKKRYVTYRCDRLGNIMGVTEKGVVLARRDNCHYLRDTYRTVSRCVLDEKSKEEVLYEIYDACYKLFTHCTPLQKFVVFKSVKDPHEYSDDSHDAHVMLARRMIARGEDVPANTRLEYVFMEIGDPEKEKLLGNKAEDYTYFRDNRAKLGLKLDPVHYLEKQLAKPLTELINVRYPGDTLEWVEPRIYLFGLIDDLPVTVKKDVYREKSRNGQIARLEEISRIKSVSLKDQKKVREYQNLIAMCELWTEETTTFEMREEMYVKIFGHTTRLCKQDRDVLTRLKEDERVRYLVYDTVSSPSDMNEEMKHHCQRLHAMIILSKLRQYYGLKAIRYHKPMAGRKTVRDEYLLRDMIKAHKNYRDVVRHLKMMFYCFDFEE